MRNPKQPKKPTRIYVESATFDPVSTRKAGRILDVHADSLARFERGADPLNAPQRDWTCGTSFGNTYQLEKNISLFLCSSVDNTPVCFGIAYRQHKEFLDIEISADDMCQRLERYGFSCKKQEGRSVGSDEEGYIDVVVPSHRIGMLIEWRTYKKKCKIDWV